MSRKTFNRYMACPQCGYAVPMLSRAWSGSRDMRCPQCGQLVEIKLNARKFFAALGVVAAASALLILVMGHSAVSFIVIATLIGPFT